MLHHSVTIQIVVFMILSFLILIIITIEKVFHKN
jgi:hypothetical protein